MAEPRRSFAYNHLWLCHMFQTLNLEQLFFYISEPNKNEFFPPSPMDILFFCVVKPYSHDARVLLNFLPYSPQTPSLAKAKSVRVEESVVQRTTRNF